MTGDPTRDNKHTPRDFGDVDDENDYTAARDERYRKKRQEMDAAHEKAARQRKAEKEGEGE